MTAATNTPDAEGAVLDAFRFARLDGSHYTRLVFWGDAWKVVCGACGRIYGATDTPDGIRFSLEDDGDGYCNELAESYE